MGWFSWALLGLSCMPLAWLTLKRAQEQGMPSGYALAIYFACIELALIAYFFLGAVPFAWLPARQAAVLVLAGSCYASSNLLVMNAFGKSPNPGLPLALLATQSIWLTLVSVLVLDVHLGAGALLGVVLVAAGVASLQLSHGPASWRWAGFGLGAGLLAASGGLLSRLSQQVGLAVHPLVVLSYVIMPQLALCVGFGIVRRQPLVLTGRQVRLLLLSAGAGGVANISAMSALLAAPNPGYAQAVTSSNALLTMLLAPWFGNASLRWRHAGTAMLIILGVVLVKLSS